MKNARIISVGDEVLSGQIVNTNSSYLAYQLTKLGFLISKHVAIGDSYLRIEEEIDSFLNSKDLVVIITGGLGPTHDDFTKEAVAEKLNLDLELREEALSLLDVYFDGEKAESDNKQAYFPKGSILIPNKIGTADGLIIEYNNKILILLVGPPHENIPMMEDYVIPYLKKNVNNNFLNKEYLIMGKSESHFEDLLKPLYNQLKNVTINPYGSIGRIRYQINGFNDDIIEFNKVCLEFEKLMKRFIISDNYDTIENKVVSLLKEKGYKISFGESCTGGMLSSMIVSVSGASSVLNESFVTYSNDAKIKHLQVNKETIDKYGVVSFEVCEEMVKGLRAVTNANVCISVSGLAGPTGKTKNLNVGDVCYSIYLNERIISEKKNFKGSRDLIRTKACFWILYRVFGLLTFGE